MKLPLIPDVARVALHLGNNSDSIRSHNVIHVQRGSSSTAWATVADQLAGYFSDSLLGNMWNCVSAALTLKDFKLTPLDGTSATLFRDVSAAGVAGQAGGSVVPQVSGLVKLTTDVRGRRSRGRVYIGPCAEDSISGGALDTARPPIITDSWVAFANKLVVDGNAIVIASYQPPVAAHQVTNLRCEEMTATQRRRLRR